METTLIILKPDTLKRRLMGEIIGRFEKKGLQMVGMKLMQISQDLAERHYAVHKEKPFYDALVSYITSAPVLVLAIRGNNAIEVCRKLMGATFGFNAEPGTIRGDFGVSKSYNLIHGSDAPESAEAELALYFKPEELIASAPADIDFIYDTTGGAPE